MGIRSWIRDLLASRHTRFEPRLREIEAEIFALPLSEARARALDVLGTDVATVTENATGETVSHPLPPGVRELLSRYSEIYVGGLRVAIDDVGVHRADTGQAEPLPDGYVIVGSDLEHASVVVRADSERVWVIEPYQMNEWLLPEPEPSIWHYLLLTARIAEPDWWR